MPVAYTPHYLFYLFLLHPLVVSASNKDIQVDGGLNDATAVVGKLFLYTIQPSAFTGHVRNYQVSAAWGCGGGGPSRRRRITVAGL